ncbi:MAG: hypothetical protein LBQ12_10100 [Deltaproteobacteria bacterium]|jgi:hypothetical protein|nr:hypothetical protein [Deltaproteobacteria bacterium]
MSAELCARLAGIDAKEAEREKGRALEMLRRFLGPEPALPAWLKPGDAAPQAAGLSAEAESLSSKASAIAGSAGAAARLRGLTGWLDGQVALHEGFLESDGLMLSAQLRALSERVDVVEGLMPPPDWDPLAEEKEKEMHRHMWEQYGDDCYAEEMEARRLSVEEPPGGPGMGVTRVRPAWGEGSGMTPSDLAARLRLKAAELASEAETMEASAESSEAWLASPYLVTPLTRPYVDKAVSKAAADRAVSAEHENVARGLFLLAEEYEAYEAGGGVAAGSVGAGGVAAGSAGAGGVAAGSAGAGGVAAGSAGAGGATLGLVAGSLRGRARASRRLALLAERSAEAEEMMARNLSKRPPGFAFDPVQLRALAESKRKEAAELLMRAEELDSGADGGKA